jgi:hypothetical protein
MTVFETLFVKHNAKCWMQVAYAVSTYKIVTTPLKEMSDFIFIGWFSVVGGVELFKRVLAAKIEGGGLSGLKTSNAQSVSERINGGVQQVGPGQAVSRQVRSGNTEGTDPAEEGVVR